MKPKLIMLFFFLFGAGTHSQTLGPKVFATSGGYYTVSGTSLSWTMGETFIAFLQNGDKMLTQGFQQPYFPKKQVNLKMFIDGFYSGGGLMQITGTGCLNNLDVSDPMYSPDPTDVDDVTVTAVDPITYLPVESKVGRLKTDGTLMVTFTGRATAGKIYYIRLNHRNLIETWSKSPVTFIPVTNYDFTTASTQAYDDGFGTLPMKLVSGSPIRWACYNGDIDQEGGVNALDMTLEENASNLGIYGYYPTDLNGDGGSNSLDMTIIENNSNIGVYSAHP